MEDFLQWDTLFSRYIREQQVDAMTNESINTTKTTPAILFSHSRLCGFVSNIYWRILLTAIGLTPGGSSTVHIYTQTEYTEQNTHNNKNT